MSIEGGQTGVNSEAVAPTEEGRVVERNFDILNTHIGDFFLLVDHGTEPDLTRSQTRALEQTGNVYAARSELIKHLLELQEEPHQELVDLGINFPGLRGGRDLKEGEEVQITPKTVSVFDDELLTKSLGARRPEFVHDKVKVTVELDPGNDDVEGFLKSLKRRLKRQGLTPEEIEQKLKVQKTLRVDEKVLQKLVEAGEIMLMPGAWGKEIKNWDIVPRKIPTKEELAELDEKAKQFTP
ncbi:hypothetical protein M1307_03600 [Patescibacteria group bacterium]|nr:hypothetical protein [Patescibacteria group bacterium]